MTDERKRARAEYMREWQKANREHLNEYQREWRKNNPEKVKATMSRHWAKQSNTLEDAE